MRGRTSVIVVASLGLVIALGVVLAILSNSDLRAGSGDPDFPQPTVIHDDPVARSAPVLSIEQQQQAIDAVLRSPRVLAILNGASYQVGETVPWTRGNEELKGAVVNLTFDEPMTLDGAWLAFSWDCDEDPIPPPTSVEYTAAYDGVTEVYSFVNIESQDVDQVFPIGEPGIGTSLLGDMVFTGEETSITSCYSD